MSAVILVREYNITKGSNTMANEVTKKEEILLWDDETKVTIKALNISSMRKFFDMFEGMKTITDNAEGLQYLAMCAGFCLAQFHPKAWKSKENEELDMDYIQDQLSQDHVNRILKVCAGMDFTDENLIKAAEQALAASQE